MIVPFKIEGQLVVPDGSSLAEDRVDEVVLPDGTVFGIVPTLLARKGDTETDLAPIGEESATDEHGVTLASGFSITMEDPLSDDEDDEGEDRFEYDPEEVAREQALEHRDMDRAMEAHERRHS